MNSLDVIYLPSKRIAHREIDGRTVIVHVEENRLVQLNETGTATWEKLDGRTVEQIAKAISEEFDVDESRAVNDVREFLEHLAARHFVESKR